MYITQRDEDEAITRACGGLEIEPKELRRRLWRAAWSPYTLRRELETEGWQKRLGEAEKEADARRVELRERALRKAIEPIFAVGPIAMARMAPGERLARLTAKQLRWIAETYDPAEHAGLLVVGPTGVGKTLAIVHAVDRCSRAAIGRSLAEHQFAWQPTNRIEFSPRIVAPVGWFRAIDLGKARRQAPLGEGEPDIVVRAMKAQVAVIDDLGWEATHDTAIAEIVAERYERKLATLVSSGLRPEEIEQRYSAAFLRRLLDGEKKGRLVNLFPREAMQ